MFDDEEVYSRKVIIVFDRVPSVVSVDTALDDLATVHWERFHNDVPYPKVFAISREGIPYQLKPEFKVGEWNKDGIRYDRINLTFKDGALASQFVRIDGNS